MPKLPTADELGPLPSLESRRGLATYDPSPLGKGAAALAEGVQKLGNAGLGIGLDMIERDQRENAVFDQAKAESAFIPAHGKILLGQQDSPDPEGYAKASQDALREAASHIRDPRARDLWMMSKAGTLTSGTATVKGLADKATADHELAGIRQSEDDGLEQVVRGSPEDADTMTRAIATRYDELAKRGLITEVQAQAYKKAYAKRGIFARVGTLDPEDQIAAYRGAPGSREETIDRINGVESGFDPTARNPSSTATGLGQFTEGTWLATVQAHRPDLAQGRSREAVLALRNNPALSREMTGHLLDDNSAALSRAGLPVTPTTQYLGHFLGSGGATALLKARPGTPVSDVLDDDQISANRSILAGKSVDDVVRWATRKMGGGPEARLASVLPADQREVGLRHAEALYDRQQREAQRALQVEAQTYRARISDDLASIEATGQGNANLRHEDIARVFGPEAVEGFRADRARSYGIHAALSGIETLPEAEALQRLQRLRPRPGAEGFQADAQAYERAAKQVDQLLSLRRSDPAKAADGLPAVAGAREAAQYDVVDQQTGRKAIQPASAQAIVRARIAAQEQLGIGSPLAVNRREADEIVRQVRAVGDDPKRLQPVMSALRRTYGKDADRVLSDSLQLHGLNQDLAEQAGIALSKIGAGARPSPSDQRNLNRAAGAQQLDDALSGKAPGPAAPPPAPAARPPVDLREVGQDWQAAIPSAAAAPKPAVPSKPEPGEFSKKPEREDLDALLSHPMDRAVRQRFDATYGEGTSERALGELRRRLGPTAGGR